MRPGILDANEGSLEYLVYSSALAGVAAQHGLTPVTDWGAPALEDFFDEVRPNRDSVEPLLPRRSCHEAGQLCKAPQHTC